MTFWHVLNPPSTIHTVFIPPSFVAFSTLVKVNCNQHHDELAASFEATAAAWKTNNGTQSLPSMAPQCYHTPQVGFCPHLSLWLSATCAKVAEQNLSSTSCEARSGALVLSSWCCPVTFVCWASSTFFIS